MDTKDLKTLCEMFVSQDQFGERESRFMEQFEGIKEGIGQIGDSMETLSRVIAEGNLRQRGRDEGQDGQIADLCGRMNTMEDIQKWKGKRNTLRVGIYVLVFGVIANISNILHWTGIIK